MARVSVGIFVNGVNNRLIDQKFQSILGKLYFSFSLGVNLTIYCAYRLLMNCSRFPVALPAGVKVPSWAYNNLEVSRCTPVEINFKIVT